MESGLPLKTVTRVSANPVQSRNRHFPFGKKKTQKPSSPPCATLLPLGGIYRSGHSTIVSLHFHTPLHYAALHSASLLPRGGDLQYTLSVSHSPSDTLSPSAFRCYGGSSRRELTDLCYYNRSVNSPLARRRVSLSVTLDGNYLYQSLG